MALIAPAAIVTGPARTPQLFGLGSVIAWRTTDRFESGVTWEALGCAPLRGRAGAYCPPDVVAGIPKPLDQFNSPDWDAEATPFAVYGDDLCSLFGSNGPSEAQARATRRLEVLGEERVEQAFWTGDLGSAPNLSGANGFTAPVSVGDYTDAEFALAAAEQGIADNYRSLGVLHMSKRTASILGGRLVVTGGRLTTRLGTPVVAGAGYPDTLEIIGTPALAGWRSEIFTSSDVPGDLLDRATNDMYAIAEQVYVIGLDPCPIVKATYTTNGDAP